MIMTMSHSFSPQRIIAALALILFGVIGRVILQDLPNIETITVVSLLAGSLLGGTWTIVVGLMTVAASDIFIGNTTIMLFTWSAWAVMGFFGWALRKRKKQPLRHALELTGMGLLGNIFFYLWTNAGVWLIGGLYPSTIDGLWMSYIAGLPFLRMQFLSTLVIVPVVSIAAIWAWNRLPQWMGRTDTADYAGDAR